MQKSGTEEKPPGTVKVDTAMYRAAAIDVQKATGEILPGCVTVGECEHLAVRFGKDSSSNAGDE